MSKTIIPLQNEVDSLVTYLNNNKNTITNINEIVSTFLKKIIQKRSNFLVTLLDTLEQLNRYIPFGLSFLEPLYQIIFQTLRNVYIGEDILSRRHLLNSYKISLLLDPIKTYHSNKHILINSLSLMNHILIDGRQSILTDFCKARGMHIIISSLLNFGHIDQVAQPALDILTTATSISETTTTHYLKEIVKSVKCLININYFSHVISHVRCSVRLLIGIVCTQSARTMFIQNNGVECILHSLQVFSHDKDIVIDSFILLTLALTSGIEHDDIEYFSDEEEQEEQEEEEDEDNNNNNALNHFSNELIDEIEDNENYSQSIYYKKTKLFTGAELTLLTIHNLCSQENSRVIKSTAPPFILRVLQAFDHNTKIVQLSLSILLDSVNDNSDSFKDRVMENLDVFQSISTIYYNNVNIMELCIRLFTVLSDGIPHHIHQIHHHGGIEFFTELLHEKRSERSLVIAILDLLTVFCVPHEDNDTLTETVHSELRDHDGFKYIFNVLNIYKTCGDVVSNAMRLLSCLCYGGRTQNLERVFRNNGIQAILSVARFHSQQHIDDAKVNQKRKLTESECPVYLAFCEAIPSFPREPIRDNGGVSCITSMLKWFLHEETIRDHSAMALLHLVGDLELSHILDDVANWEYKEQVCLMWDSPLIDTDNHSSSSSSSLSSSSSRLSSLPYILSAADHREACKRKLRASHRRDLLDSSLEPLRKRRRVQ